MTIEQHAAIWRSVLKKMENEELLTSYTRTSFPDVNNVLVSIIRAGTSMGTENDITLASHVYTCHQGKNCPYPNCVAAKARLEHYKFCTNTKCFYCVSARFILAKSQGLIDDKFEEKFVLEQAKLLILGNEVKNTIQEFVEAKSSAERLSYIREDLTEKKLRLNEAKIAFQELCVEVFQRWFESQKQVQNVVANSDFSEEEIVKELQEDLKVVKSKENELLRAREHIHAKHVETLRKLEAKKIEKTQELDKLTKEDTDTISGEEQFRKRIRHLETDIKQTDDLSTRLKLSISSSSDTGLLKQECPVCLVKPEQRKVFQCGHIFCHECAARVQTCPTCRKPVTMVLPLFV